MIDKEIIATIIFKTISVVIYCLFAFFVITRCFTATIQYDDSYYASVAKNLASGIGYKTTYDKEQLFDPEIVVGPTLILPTAFMISIFGNQYWVPSLTTALITLSLLIFICFYSRVFFTNANYFWKYAMFASIFLVLFSASEETIYRPFTYFDGHFSMRLWHKLYGEIPAGLLSVLATMILFRQPLIGYRLFLAGVLFGFSALTKLISIFAFFSAFIWITILLYVQKRKKIVILLIFISGFTLPLIIFETFKIITFGDIGIWREHWIGIMDVFRGGYSGINEFAQTNDKISLFKHNFLRNIKILVVYFGYPIQIFALCLLLCSIPFFLTRLFFRKNRQSIILVSISLVSAFLVHITWWLLFCPVSWTRYLYPSLIYLAISVAIFVTVAQDRRISFIIVLLLLIILSIPRIPKFHYITKPYLSKDSNLTALLDAKDFIIRHIDKNSILIGCGWSANRELEYLLPGAGNFRDGLKLNIPVLNNKNIILIKSPCWNDGESQEISEFEKKCGDNILFEKGPYQVVLCNKLNGR